MKQVSIFIKVPLVLALVSIFTACSYQKDEVIGLKKQIDSLTNQLASLSAANQQIEANKKMVADFYQELFGDKNIEVVDKYIVEDYIQHNPHVADGRAALKEALETWFRNAPKENIDIQHLGADGNFVYIHTKSKAGNKVTSVIDIFKVVEGKIVEHWDVIQDVPEKSVNPHPMF